MTETEILVRLSIATVAGLLIGLDREIRGIAAGMRTHALVSMSSALITISALMLFYELQDSPGADLDPIRVVQGLAQALGFVAAGVIFVSGGNVHNLTSAANIWLAAGIGIAAGAGQLLLAGAGLLFGIFILTVVRVVEALLPGGTKDREDHKNRDDGAG